MRVPIEKAYRLLEILKRALKTEGPHSRSRLLEILQRAVKSEDPHSKSINVAGNLTQST